MKGCTQPRRAVLKKGTSPLKPALLISSNLGHFVLGYWQAEGIRKGVEARIEVCKPIIVSVKQC